MFLKGSHHFRHCGGLLSYGDVNTDHVFALLVQDSVQSQGSLTCLSVADDQLPLSPSNGKHGVNGKNTCLQRHIYRLPVNDTRRGILHRTVFAFFDLAFAVDGSSKSVDDPADKAVANGNTRLLSCPGNLRSLTDPGITSEKDTAHAVAADILHHTLQSVVKDDNLSVHSVIDPVNSGNSVSHRDDSANLLVPADLIIILYFFF